MASIFGFVYIKAWLHAIFKRDFKVVLGPYDKYTLAVVLLYYWIYLACHEKSDKILGKPRISSPFYSPFDNFNIEINMIVYAFSSTGTRG